MIFLGDSHSRYFRHAAEEGFLLPWRVSVCEVSGATAGGLINPDSKTAAAKKYFRRLEREDKNAFVVMHLGEVDCGILIWMRSQKNATSLRIEMQRSVNAYFVFVDQVIAAGFGNVIVTGATAPTINDTDHIGSIVTQRRAQVDASHLQRTELTRQFNEALRAEAHRRSLIYVDVWDDVMDPLTQVADVRFRNQDVKDHHMDLDAAAMVWSLALRRAVSSDVDVTASNVALVAKEATFIRAVDRHPKIISDAMKISVSKGQRLSGRLVARTKKSLVFDDMNVDGSQLDERFRFVFGPRWEKDETVDAHPEASQ